MKHWVRLSLFFLFSFIVLIIFSTPAKSFNHDVSIEKVLTPVNGTYTQSVTDVKIRVKNQGTTNELNTKVFVSNNLYKSIGNTLDSSLITYFPFQTAIDITVHLNKSITLNTNTSDTIVVSIRCSTDENPTNDTARIIIHYSVTYQRSVKIASILFPQRNITIPKGEAIPVTATFKNNSPFDFFDLPVRLQILSIPGNTIVYQVDTFISSLPVFAPSGEFSFPSFSGTKDTRQLSPGDYKARVTVLAVPNSYPSYADSALFSISQSEAVHDLRITEFISPKARYPGLVPVIISARFQNSGKDTINSSYAYIIVKDAFGFPKVTDSTIVFQWFKDSSKIVTFNPLSLSEGTYTCTTFVHDLGDEFSSNDSLSFSFFVGNNRGTTNDLAVDQILVPTPTQALDATVAITPKILVHNYGYNYQTNIPCRLTISSNTIIRDTIFISLAPNSSATYSFKSLYLNAGQYKMAVISALATDEYRYDDTAQMSLSVPHTLDVRVVAITSPKPYENIIPGSRISVHALARRKGTDKPTRQIETKALIVNENATQVMVFFFYRLSPSEFLNSDTVEEIFPDHNSAFDTKALPPGFYRLFVITSDIQDTLTIPFQIGFDRYEDNLKLLSILPSDSSIFAWNKPCELRFKALNNGKHIISNAHIVASLRDERNTIVFRDTFFIKTMAPTTEIDTVFKPFTISYPNKFLFSVYSMAVSDNNRNDDSMLSHISNYQQDVAVVLVNIPSSHQRIKEGTYFSPTCTFHTDTVWGKLFYEPVQIVIEDSASSLEIARGFTVIPELPIDGLPHRVTFPAQMPGLDVTAIPVGSYKIKFIVSHFDDNNPLNDTGSAFFNIYNPIKNSVGETSTTDKTSIPYGHPNPFSASTSLRYILPNASKVSIRILDITGKTIHQFQTQEFEAEGEHSKSISLDGFPNGTYIAEITFQSMSGEIETNRILVVHSK